MKVEELRYGNWVNWYNHTFRIGIIEEYYVEPIGRNEGGFPCEDLRPIPLTEEILLNVCKSWRSFHDGVIIYEFGLFDFWSQNGQIWLNKDFKEWLPQIEFVHELQNLFWILTGNELTINL